MSGSLYRNYHTENHLIMCIQEVFSVKLEYILFSADRMTRVVYVGYGRTVIIAICISAPVCLITLAVMLYIYLRDRRLTNHPKCLIESDLELGERKMPESIQDIIEYEQTYSGGSAMVYYADQNRLQSRKVISKPSRSNGNIVRFLDNLIRLEAGDRKEYVTLDYILLYGNDCAETQKLYHDVPRPLEV